MHRNSKTTTKLQQIFHINKLKIKIMKTYYQIAVKGVFTNEISLINKLTFKEYKNALKQLSKEESLILLESGLYQSII